MNLQRYAILHLYMCEPVIAFWAIVRPPIQRLRIYRYSCTLVTNKDRQSCTVLPSQTLYSCTVLPVDLVGSYTGTAVLAIHSTYWQYSYVPQYVPIILVQLYQQYSLYSILRTGTTDTGSRSKDTAVVPSTAPNKLLDVLPVHSISSYSCSQQQLHVLPVPVASRDVHVSTVTYMYYR